MEKLSKIINPKKFIRVNRQFIVSKKAITKYTEIENRKIEIFVSPSTQKGSRIIVSSKKRTQIIKWILNN
jgi:DNA-binding LytR/AlgR family response regulator